MPPQPGAELVEHNANKSSLEVFSSETREKVEKFFNNFDHKTYKQVNPNLLNEDELREVLDKLKTEFKTNLKALDEDIYHHVAFFLLRASVVSTSPKVEYKGSYSYSIDQRKYTVNDAWIFPQVNILASKHNKPNGLRAFCASLEGMYLSVARMVPDVFGTRSVGKRGAPSGSEYLSADFLTSTCALMSDHDRAVALSASRNALDRSAASQIDKKMVSLYDFGKVVYT